MSMWARWKGKAGVHARTHARPIILQVQAEDSGVFQLQSFCSTDKRFSYTVWNSSVPQSESTAPDAALHTRHWRETYAFHIRNRSLPLKCATFKSQMKGAAVICHLKHLRFRKHQVVVTGQWWQWRSPSPRQGAGGLHPDQPSHTGF